VAPEGTPQPVLDTVSITGPLPLPVEQGPLIIAVETPPEGVVTVGYAFALHASGGTKPYTWTLAAGALPAGLALSTGGHVTGTPTATGGSTAVFECTDADGHTDTEAFGFVVVPLSKSAIREITSTDGSVTITDPTGPTTDLSTAGGGGALEYIAETASLGLSFALSNDYQTYQVTQSFDIGTWLLTVTANYFLNGTPGTGGFIRAIQGATSDSATVDFITPAIAGNGEWTVEIDCILSFICIMKVTKAGTIDLQAVGNYRGEIAGSLGASGAGQPVTGYSAIRISTST
jgi:hypothetical protein